MLLTFAWLLSRNPERSRAACFRMWAWDWFKRGQRERSFVVPFARATVPALGAFALVAEVPPFLKLDRLVVPDQLLRAGLVVLSWHDVFAPRGSLSPLLVVTVFNEGREPLDVRGVYLMANFSDRLT